MKIKQAEGNQMITPERIAEIDVDQLRKELRDTQEALIISEEFRRAYRDGKYKLYALGGEICDAAGEHLPASEGPLDRFTASVERKAFPLIAAQLRACVEQLDAATKRAAAAEKDTARIDYCEEKGQLGAVIWRGIGSLGWLVMGQKTLQPTLREAIDAARSQSTDKGETDGK